MFNIVQKETSRECIADEPRPGRSSISIIEEEIEKIRDRAKENHHLTVRELAEEVDILICSVNAILSDVSDI